MTKSESYVRLMSFLADRKMYREKLVQLDLFLKLYLEAKTIMNNFQLLKIKRKILLDRNFIDRKHTTLSKNNHGQISVLADPKDIPYRITFCE